MAGDSWWSQQFETVGVICPAGAATLCSPSGSPSPKNNILCRLVVSVTTPATSTLSISTSTFGPVAIVPVNTPIGVYSVEIGIKDGSTTSPGWTVTCGAGVSAVAVGRFV